MKKNINKMQLGSLNYRNKYYFFSNKHTNNTIYEINIKYIHILLFFKKIFFIKLNICKVNNINILLLILIIILNLPKYFFSEISLVIKGKGEQKILSDDFIFEYYNDSNENPFELFVNGNLQNYTGKSIYNLNEQTNNITIKFNFQLNSCKKMFYNLDNIIKFDLSKFDSSQVTDMTSMFEFCTSLTILNINNIDTSKVINMKKMFSHCYNLLSLDLNSLNTSSVKDMSQMFSGCYILLSLDLNSFNTSSVITMSEMFYFCRELKSLDLSNFNTSMVSNMFSMFLYCEELILLDLSNFNTTNVLHISKMFYNCYSLISLNINSFDTSKITDFSYMFYNCSSLISLNIINFNILEVNNMDYMFYRCNSLISLNLYKFYTFNKTSYLNMFLYCNHRLIYCINDGNRFIFDSYNFLNDNNNCLDYCFNNLYNKIIKENNKCIDNCSKDDKYIYESNNICHLSCPYGTNISFNKYLCENENIIPIIDINNNNNETFTECSSLDFFNNKCKINNDSNLNKNFKDNMIKNIKNDLFSGALDLLLLDIINGNKEEIIMKDNDTIFQITTIDNQKNNKNNNISTILFGECEQKLKSYYNISENQTLILLKIDYFKKGSLIPIIGYEVFNSFTKEILDLKYCNDTYINLNIPVSIDENNIFKYDPNSEYYTDICNSYTTQSGTDILLNDRQKEYNNNNMAICENNCTFIGYEENTKNAKCECEIKTEQLTFSEIDNQTDLFYYNFSNKNISSNMVTMKCVYTLFTKDGIASNIASYIFIFFSVIFVISGILFYKFGFHLFEEDIKEIISFKEENNKNNKDMNKNETVDINMNDKNINKKIKKIKKKKKKKEKNKRNNKRNIDQINFDNSNNQKSIIKLELKTSKDINYNNKKITEKSNNYKDNIKLNSFNIFNDYELNSLSYHDALKYDKRTFSSYYFSLIKIKHPLIFSFFPIKDYNSIIIRIDIFLLSFSLYYFFNALFFDESTIHKIYEDEGSYNFIYLIPFISYSFIISHTLTIIIKYFSLSERNICEIKNQKILENAIDKVDKVRKFLINKYICFYISGTIFLLFFWYYLSSFGAVYKNTQIYLIKNTLISFGFSLLYPFIINILPCIIRIISLKKTNRKFLYKINRIIQLI